MKHLITLVAVMLSAAAFATTPDIDIDVPVKIDNNVKVDTNIRNTNAVKMGDISNENRNANDNKNWNANKNENNATAHGGAGGQGGAGGDGGDGGSSWSANKNDNTAHGGKGGSSQVKIGDTSATGGHSSVGDTTANGGHATGGSADGSGNSTISDVGNASMDNSGNSNLQMENSLTSQGGTSSSSNDGNAQTSNVNVEGDDITYEAAASAAYAPPAFTNMQCAETLGLAYQTKTGGGSLGVPVPRWLANKKYRDCESVRDSIWLAHMGLPLAAMEARCATRSMIWRFGGTETTLMGQINNCVEHFAGRIAQRMRAEQARLDKQALLPTPTAALKLDKRPPVSEIVVLDPAPVEQDCHPHDENDDGYLKYDGETYKNVKRFRKASEICGNRE